MAESVIKKDIPFRRPLVGVDLNDLNSESASGLYEVRNGCTNTPAPWIWLLVIGGLGTTQVAFSTSWIKTRAYTGSPITWTEWKTVYMDNQTATNLTSSTHEVSGTIIRTGNLVSVTGFFKVKNASSETIITNAPLARNSFGIACRNHISGVLSVIWAGNNNGHLVLETFGHQGTFNVDDLIVFSFAYVAQS